MTLTTFDTDPKLKEYISDFWVSPSTVQYPSESLSQTEKFKLASAEIHRIVYRKMAEADRLRIALEVQTNQQLKLCQVCYLMFQEKHLLNDSTTNSIIEASQETKAAMHYFHKKISYIFSHYRAYGQPELPEYFDDLKEIIVLAAFNEILELIKRPPEHSMLST